MIQVLDPPLRLVTPYGSAFAAMVIDPGHGHHLQWVCFYRTGKLARQCWTWNNPLVRWETSITDGIPGMKPTELFKSSRSMMTTKQWEFVEAAEVAGELW